jgi:hypothetical protein
MNYFSIFCKFSNSLNFTLIFSNIFYLKIILFLISLFNYLLSSQNFYQKTIIETNAISSTTMTVIIVQLDDCSMYLPNFPCVLTNFPWTLST